MLVRVSLMLRGHASPAIVVVAVNVQHLLALHTQNSVYESVLLPEICSSIPDPERTHSVRPV